MTDKLPIRNDFPIPRKFGLYGRPDSISSLMRKMQIGDSIDLPPPAKTSQRGKPPAPPPTPSEFRALIRRSAISPGMAIPETDQEFALSEQGVDPSKLPSHDFSKVVKLFQRATPSA